jgi:hypothetical protein
VVQETFIHPFSNEELLSISTGITVEQSDASNILEAEEKGKSAMSKFYKERMLPGRTNSFFDNLPKQKLKTFESLNKKKILKTKAKEVSICNSKDLFSKVAIISQKRSIDLKRLFHYPLMHLPLSIAEPTGTLRKAQKSSLLHTLENNLEPLAALMDDYTFIADCMAFVHQIKVHDLTYSQFVHSLLSYIIGSSGIASRIYIVFDVYRQNSIKDVERARRSTGSIVLKRIISSAQIKISGKG